MGANKKIYGWYPTDEDWLPVQVDEEGKVVMSGVALHHTTHEDGGTDEIYLGGLSGANIRRTVTITSSATPTPNSDITDIYIITALQEAATFGAPTGSPAQGQMLIIRIKDNATARALSWNAIYRIIGTTLPTTTVLGKTLYLGFIYNSTDTKWDLVATAQAA